MSKEFVEVITGTALTDSDYAYELITGRLAGKLRLQFSQGFLTETELQAFTSSYIRNLRIERPITFAKIDPYLTTFIQAVTRDSGIEPKKPRRLKK